MAAIESQKVRVLVADDNPDMRDLVVQLLLDNGARVLEAVGSGTELVRLALEMWPDVIVSDYYMPDLSGVEAMQALRKVSCGIPFVLLTTAPGRAQDWSGLGPLGVVDKLDAEVDLVRAIEAAVSGHSFLSRSVSRS